MAGTYAGADADLDSSKLIHPELLSAQRRHAAILYQEVGRGKVFVFSIDPTFRGVWWGTASLLANALYIAAAR